MGDCHIKLTVFRSLRIWSATLVSVRNPPLMGCALPGSWEGDIRLWKLDAKLKSFALIGTVPAPGVVNSLQLISAPQDAFPPTSWACPRPSGEPAMAQRNSASSSKVILLVAGMGQEHRLGRWMRLKGDGIVNGTIVVALHPRTLE